jgi:polyisoprenoid-binding protein YceI
METNHLRFGPDNGRMVLRTGRKGVGSTVGHDLTIEVTAWSAQIDVPESDLADATVTANIDLRSLAVREGRGGALPLTDKDRAEIKNTASQTLDVGRYPTATFQSSRFVPGDDDTMISGTLTLHGAAAPVDIHLREVAPGRYRADAVVTQSAYGIKPYTAFLGALKVRDDVNVEIDLDHGH